MDDNNRSFSYTYSATQQAEVKRIRQKYLPPEEDRMAQLRRLDKCATRTGCVLALTLGICSALVLGVGMCCTMLWTQYFIPGVLLGILGIGGVCAAYPVYTSATKRQRQRLAPEIMRLSQELLGQE